MFEGVRCARVGRKWGKEPMGNQSLSSWSGNKVIHWRGDGEWGRERAWLIRAPFLLLLLLSLLSLLLSVFVPSPFLS